jgi:hypothetical protein
MRSPVIPLALTLLGCSSPAAEAPRPVPVEPLPVVQPSPREGITIEHVQGPAPLGMGDGVITLVRFDMSFYRPVMLLAASRDGRARTLPEWAAQEHLVGGINLAMYEPDGRPTSFVIEEGVERSPDDTRFGGLLAFGPVSEEDYRPFVMTGRDCEGGDLTLLRSRYQNIVANYRMLNCAGGPIAWVDEHRYSSAAFGVDRQGDLVLIHAATPYLMRDLARVLAEPALGLVQIDYVEGGPEATLFVDDGVTQTTLIGYPRDAAERRPDQAPYPPEQVGRAWPLPNVLGLVAR